MDDLDLIMNFDEWLRCAMERSHRCALGLISDRRGHTVAEDLVQQVFREFATASSSFCMPAYSGDNRFRELNGARWVPPEKVLFGRIMNRAIDTWEKRRRDAALVASGALPHLLQPNEMDPSEANEQTELLHVLQQCAEAVLGRPDADIWMAKHLGESYERIAERYEVSIDALKNKFRETGTLGTITRKAPSIRNCVEQKGFGP